jgi:hypothetical protein
MTYFLEPPIDFGGHGSAPCCRQAGSSSFPIDVILEVLLCDGIVGAIGADFRNSLVQQFPELVIIIAHTNS